MSDFNASDIQWRREDSIQVSNGVLVASDQKLEWLLPWWWAHYRAHNDLPVAFVDFGMSPAAVEWCKERGEYTSFTQPLDFLVLPENIPSDLKDKWEVLFHNKEFWRVRSLCLKKPLAMLQSPFVRTLWTDLDCEIKGSIQPLFENCNNKIGFAIAPQPEFALQNYIKKGLLEPGQKTYNAGVVVYRYQSPLVLKWAQGVAERNQLFPGDSDLLADIIRAEKIVIHELSQLYNWRMAQGANPRAVIVHWVADWGKQHIRESLQDLQLETF